MEKVQKRNNLPKNTLQVNSRTEIRTQTPRGISYQFSGPGNVLHFHRDPIQLQPPSEPGNDSGLLL